MHLILNQFRNNSMVANPRKFQIMFHGSNIYNRILNFKITFMIENKGVKSRSDVKLLAIKIGDKLSFTTHTENLYNTASNRLWSLARMRHLSKQSIYLRFILCQLLRTVLWSGCIVVKPQTILLTKSINAAFGLYMKWKMQISKIY